MKFNNKIIIFSRNHTLRSIFSLQFQLLLDLLVLVPLNTIIIYFIILLGIHCSIACPGFKSAIVIIIVFIVDLIQLNFFWWFFTYFSLKLS